MQDRQSSKEISTTNKIFKAFANGTVIMLTQAPLVNAFNQWSVVAGRHNLSTIDAFTFILRSGSKPSILNFRKGMAGHLTKEIPRLGFKSVGLYIYKPYFDVRFSPYQSEVTFALSLSVAEILINPFDYWRVRMQSGDPMTFSLKALFAGSFINGARQFGTWLGFGISNRVLNPFLKEHTQFDPHSIAGILVKSYPQALFFTSLVYPLERIKNEVQFNVEKTGKSTARVKHPYIEATKSIVQKQGYIGFLRGFYPKVLSNSVLAIGANMLVEMGKNQMKK